MKKEFLFGGIALVVLVAAVLFLPRPGGRSGNDVSVPSTVSVVSYANAYISEVSSPDTSRMINVSSMSAEESAEFYRKLGAAEAIMLDHSKIYAQGKQLIVYRGEIDSYLASVQLSGGRSTEEETYQSIIERQALCNAAKNVGLAPKKEVVKQAVEKNRAAVEATTDGKAQIDAFVSGLGMSGDEYWSTIDYTHIENSMLYKSYINTLKPAFLKKYNLDPLTNVNSSNFAYKAEWTQAVSDEAQRLIALDGVVKK